MNWEKKIPDKEGLWLRQCAAKGHEQLKTVTKFIHEDGTEGLIMDWGWVDESRGVDLLTLDKGMTNKIKSFYWYGPIGLPPNSNKLLVVKEYRGHGKR